MLEIFPGCLVDTTRVRSRKELGLTEQCAILGRTAIVKLDCM
jgi:hypothetical protein